MRSLLISAVVLVCYTGPLSTEHRYSASRPSYTPGKFPYTTCRETSGTVTCNSLNISKERRAKQSKWPPGPYAIPMTKYGCPESASRGWTKGVINLGEDRKQRFCVKLKRDQTLDKGNWIPGHYNIYMSGKTCPEGFTNFERTLNINKFNVYGYVPTFKTSSRHSEIGIKYMNLTLCEQNSTNIEQGADNSMLETFFMLEKKGDNDCPNSTAEVSQSDNFDHNKYCLNIPEQKHRMSGVRLLSAFHLSKGRFPKSELLSSFVISKQSFPQSVSELRTVKDMIQSQESFSRMPQDIDIVWYQFDMMRSLSVSTVELFGIDRDETSETVKLWACYYDDVMWSFLDLDAMACHVETSHTSQKLQLYLRNVKGRFITLVFEERVGFKTTIHEESTSIFITNLDSQNGEMCNEDLGMKDGSIRDFQIYASSWHKTVPSAARPKSPGWCSVKSDKNPWILVDLIASTTVEGVSIWNKANNYGRDTNVWSFYLYYGMERENLNIYNETTFDVHLDKTRSKTQTFIMPMPFIARYVKLEVWTGLLAEKRCISLEIQGCKLSDPVQLFPSFMDYDGSVTSNIQYIDSTTIIATIGYPFSISSGQDYKWQINVSEKHFITLVFTNVSLDLKQKLQTAGTESSCDILVIRKEIKTGSKSKTIDHLFNGRIFVVETGESLLFLTFKSCLSQKAITSRGFRAIVSEKEIPGCLSVGSNKPWTQERNEVCNKPKMLLTSMSILNIPFKNEERWHIYAGKHKSLQIEFIDFYVICPEVSGIFSIFKIIDFPDDRRYCNTDMPPKILYSKHSDVTVIFQKYDYPNQKMMRREGFRLQYSKISHNFEHLTDFIESSTEFETTEFDAVDKVCSKAFRKCYYVISSRMSWSQAGTTCWQHNINLVSIFSTNELQYIHYLLRDKRYREPSQNAMRANRGSHLVAHIGLIRLRDKQRRVKYVWHNNSPMTFSAWSPRNPTKGDCTRTNFQHFNTGSTWESEGCSGDLAQYFICETQMDENKAELMKDKICGVASLTNHPYMNVTYSGKSCQHWIALTGVARLNYEETVSDRLLPKTASNFCQDPSALGMLWCYTTDPSKLWEPCFINESREEVTQDFAKNISYDKFECDNEKEIPAIYRCDGIFDCLDLTDEILCPDIVKSHLLVSTKHKDRSEKLPDTLESGSYHFCGSKEWVSVIAKCDGVIDCLDASDEVNCTRSLGECNNNEFPCADGSCIHASQVCDFISDCANADDESCEFRPCSLEEYMCDNKQCIPNLKRCDGIPDCIDKSDEFFCGSCADDAFHCDGNKCIQQRLKCDKFPDYEDESDEKSCDLGSLSSCDEWWELGYRKSGQYIIGQMTVNCDFSSVETAKGTIKMTIRNIDVTFKKYRTYVTLYTRTTDDVILSLDERNVFKNLLSRNDYKCLLEVKSSCNFPESEASFSDDPNGSFVFPYCHCAVIEFKTKEFQRPRPKLRFGKRSVGNYERVTDDYKIYKLTVEKRKKCTAGSSVALDRTRMDYRSNLRQLRRFYVDRRILNNEIPVQIITGPATCSYGYTPDKQRDVLSCKDDGKVVPKSMLCVYDVDAAGYTVGCRSGSHLQNCGTMVCPNNTVKCPESYCIPLRFVCDGSVHCPRGEDEEDCFCSDSGREIVILTEDTSHDTDVKTTATMLAKQFYTYGSVIRVLHYKANRRFEGHDILEIREEYINPFEALDRMQKCHYNTMARNVLHSIQFSSDGPNGLVFIEDSEKSSQIAEIMFSNISEPGFTVYRVIKSAESLYHKYNHYINVKDVRINKWSSLSSMGYKHFPEICKAGSTVPCSGAYRCLSSKQCIPLEQVCDGIVQCRNADDERLCGFKCPRKCKCGGQVINCRSVDFDESDIQSLSVNTRSVDISQNPGIQNVLSQHNLNFPFMLKLNVSFCEIKTIHHSVFSGLNNLRSLDLGYNKIVKLPDELFSNLYHLSILNLDGNFELTVISSLAFHGMRSIRNLRISGTKLKRISELTFSGLTLETIDISNNKIEEIEDKAFNNISVRTIDFTNNNIVKFNKFIFKDVTSLQELHTPAFKFCCIRPCYVDENNCFPKRNEFSSCGDLIRHPVLQATLWLVGVASLFGNFGSIMYRLTYDRERLKIGYGIFVTNLAAADFLMGVYLIMIATVDSLYRNSYIYMDDQWRNSKWCATAGVLSTVSSEASVLFVCLITLDRLLVIKYPFGTKRFGPKKAYLCCSIAWVFSLILALIPILYTSYFQNRFYSRSGVCIALPLTRDKPPGWMYSVAIFVGLNFCTFILVAIGQVSIFLELRKARRGIQKTLSSRRRDLRVARNLILVATTDFLCWFPIGLMGIMALNGHPIPGDVYAWTAVFILPLNSALNPVLYTLSAIIGKQSFNPNTEEQSRIELQKEIGSVLLQHQRLSRFVRTKSEIGCGGKARKLQDIMKEESVSVGTAAAVAIHLAKYLSLLHESSIGVETLADTNTYIKVDKNKKQRMSILLDTKTTLISDTGKKQDNIYQYGQLLKKLIASCDKGK